MKKKRGFTLVELLAVIVILAVILIIAMPKISDVIKNSKESSLETTAKLIASQAEKKYTENQVLDNSSTIKCSDVAKISDADYESCNITFDDKGNAKVTIVGRGKFEGLAIYDGTKNSASSTSTAPTDTSYFTYSEVEGGISITGYNIEGGTDVVIPSQIDGKTVVAIGNNAFNDGDTGLGLGITSVIIPNTITSIGRNAFEGNKLTNVTIPSSVTLIAIYAFANNKLTNVEIPSSITRIGDYAFADNKITLVKFPSTPITFGCDVFKDNPITEDSTYSFPSNVTVSCVVN